MSPIVAEAGLTDGNIFLDTSSSLDRGAEFAYEVSTCVTPSHNVYSALLSRYLLPQELLAVQGIFRCDVSNKQAFDNLLETKSKDVPTSLAQDIAGNSFTGTVVQAVCLAALASSSTWERIQPEETRALVPAAMDDQRPEDSRRGQKRKLAEDDEISHPLQQWLPSCRIRGKTSQSQMQPASKKVKRKRGQGKGNKQAKGKQPMATIAQKEAIFQALEDAKKSGAANPYKELAKKKLPGFYPGCTFRSKWGHVRETQRWDLLVQTAPQVCSKFKELPNSIRRIMQFDKMKHGESNCPSQKNSCLPFALKEVIEGLIMDRVDMGEEVTIQFVKSTILFSASLWNENIESMKQILEAKKMDMLQVHDEELSNMSPEEIDKLFDDLTERAAEILQPVNLTETDGALLTLG